ncbi:MAG: lipoate--protein ligase family protein [Planctomycetes bacterium]|nr:lipoate--protein ligase family protein [Planctomycetota bacterium]
MKYYIIEDFGKHPAWNMAVDEFFLREARDAFILRLYTFTPAGLSIGHSQGYDGAMKLAIGMPDVFVVRRLTGGGAILHENDLTYSIVCPLDSPFLSKNFELSFFDLCSPLVNALESVGVQADFRGGLSRDDISVDSCFDRETSFDIVHHDRKVIGSAQRRTNEAILQHGSILLRSNRVMADSVALEKVSSNANISTLGTNIVAAYAAKFGMHPTPAALDAGEIAKVEELARTKYLSPEWNKGE